MTATTVTRKTLIALGHGVTLPAKSAAVETRQWVAQVAYQYHDAELDAVLDECYCLPPFPVLVGPGEPHRAESIAKLNLPNGHRLIRFWPDGCRQDACEF